MKRQNSLKKSGTDWKRIDAMADADIDVSDIAEVTPEMFANYEKLAARKQRLGDFFMASPLRNSGLVIERDK